MALQLCNVMVALFLAFTAISCSPLLRKDSQDLSLPEITLNPFALGKGIAPGLIFALIFVVAIE